MATNFPGSVDDASTVGDDTHPSADELLSSTDGGPAHHALHQNVGLAINAIEDKVGTGASTPVAGSVLTGTGSGTSAWSNAPLYVDTANNRVAVNATSFGAEFEVHGSSNPELRIRSTDASDPALVFGDAVDGARASILYDTSEDRLHFRGYDNTNRMVIDSSGQVGIGTTSPAQALEVNGQVVIGAGDDITPDGTGNGHLKIDGNGYSSFFTADATGTWIGGNSASRSMILATDETARLTVGGTGLVGIGTTSPSCELEVRGSSNPEIRLVSSDASDPAIYFGDSVDAVRAGFYYDISANKLVFRGYNNTSRMVINSSGRVGIGDTAPNSQLEVVSTDERAFRFDRAEDVASGGVTCGIMQIGTDSTNPGTDDYWILLRRGDATTIGSIRGTGSASVNFSTTSDATLKTDQGIATADRIGTIIDELQVHEFDWNEGDVTGQIGLFAQEAIDVLPESIVNAPTTMPADQEGADDEYVPAALDYSKIVPILIAECQFLRARVATLEDA